VAFNILEIEAASDADDANAPSEMTAVTAVGIQSPTAAIVAVQHELAEVFEQEASCVVRSAERHQLGNTSRSNVKPAAMMASASSGK